MTALTEYQRLEATAIWRPDPEAQRRDVYVSLGDATLVIHDGREVALSHWSLPAVLRLNPGGYPARYAPGEASSEEIEVADPAMIEAIDRVRRAVERARPRPGRLRGGIIAALVVAVLGAGVFWVPGALARQTASIVPEAARAAIGDAMLAELRPLTGPPCASPQGTRALAALSRRLLSDDSTTLMIVPDGVLSARHLPDGTILLGRALVEDYETPEVVAGYVLAETQRMRSVDPLEEMLHAAGIGAALRLLTTGEVPQAAIGARARALVAQDDPPLLPAEGLVPRFATAGVPITPYAYALDITGETTVDLIEADSVRTPLERPILSDQAWVALQNICGP
ncbi:hypothetical protein ACRDNQ_16415 [Palleronia sp. KMU-117]|uniref:hypothetical protein n=1 Tax=Palleronia sp. KMU-117 TaxID=3434108 RepID=UPI003D723FB0